MHLLHYVSHYKFAPSQTSVMAWFPGQSFFWGGGVNKSTVWILSSSLSRSKDVKPLQGNPGKVKFWRFTPPRRFLPRSAIKLHPIFDLPTTCTLLCYSKPGIIIKLKSMALNIFKYLRSCSQWDVNNKKSEGFLHLFLLYINELGSFDRSRLDPQQCKLRDIKGTRHPFVQNKNVQYFRKVFTFFAFLDENKCMSPFL